MKYVLSKKINNTLSTELSGSETQTKAKSWVILIDDGLKIGIQVTVWMTEGELNNSLKNWRWYKSEFLIASPKKNEYDGRGCVVVL